MLKYDGVSTHVGSNNGISYSECQENMVMGTRGGVFINMFIRLLLGYVDLRTLTFLTSREWKIDASTISFRTN